MKFFLSFNEKDAAFADELRESLARRGLDVWNPRLLYPGSNWLLETGRALEQSEAVIFVVSKNTVDSLSLRAEVQFVIGRLKYENRVFVVMLQQRVKMPWILERMTLIKAADRDAHRAARQILASIPSAAASVGGRRASAKAGVDPRVFSDKAGVMRHAGAPDKAGVRDTKASDKAFVVRHLNVRDKAKARHVSVSNKVHPDRDKTSGNTRKAKAKGTGSAVIRKAHTGLKRRVVKPAKTAPTSSTTAVKA